MNFTRIAYTVSLLIVGLGFAVNGYSQSFLTNGLVAYYPFNGNANDASGNGHNGVVNGTTISPSMNQVGMTNGALHFEGGSYISVTPTPFNVNSNWTISCWCVFDASATGACDVVSTGPYFANGLTISHLGSYTGPPGIEWALSSSTDSFLGAVANNPSSWTMLTCVRNGSSCEMFFNNTLVASNTVVGTTLDTGKLWFGRNEPGLPGPYDLFGSLSDIRIYNRALSTNEIQQLFAYESVPQLASEVTIIRAVVPSFYDLIPGRNYQLQISPNLDTWTNYGGPFTATNTSMVYPQYFDVDSWNSLYFRAQVSPEE